MEHSLTQMPELRSPWRTATLVASAIAAIELVVLLVVGVSLLAEPVARHVTQTAEAKEYAVTPKRRPAAAVGAPAMARSQVSVIVLNGSGRTGAAAATAERTRTLGYTIGNVGNAPRMDYTRSLVMYRKGYAPEAQRLAKDLRLKIVGPLDGLRPAELLGAHVAVVVGE